MNSGKKEREGREREMVGKREKVKKEGQKKRERGVGRNLVKS